MLQRDATFVTVAQKTHMLMQRHLESKHMSAHDVQIEWCREVLREEVSKGSMMKVSHSFQGHLPSGKQWTPTIDEILISNIGMFMIIVSVRELTWMESFQSLGKKWMTSQLALMIQLQQRQD